MGQTLVIIPGWSRNKKSYRKLVALSPQGWTTFVVPLSEIIKGTNFEENFTNFLTKNRLDKISLLGHSVGGLLAIKFASSNQERIDKLFLIDSEGIEEPKSFPILLKDFLKSHLANFKKKASENLLAIFRLLRSPMFYFKLAKLAERSNIREEALTLKIPTTIIWGEKDYLTKVDQGKELQKLIPDSRLIILKDMDHDWILHKPELFWENIV